MNAPLEVASFPAFRIASAIASLYSIEGRFICGLRKKADIWRRYHWFPRQMTSEKRAQKFHADDVSLPRSG